MSLELACYNENCAFQLDGTCRHLRTLLGKRECPARVPELPTLESYPELLGRLVELVECTSDPHYATEPEGFYREVMKLKPTEEVSK